MTISNERAFPISGDRPHELGLTKREYIAAQIMAGLITNISSMEQSRPVILSEKAQQLATASVVYADALIAALNQEQQ